MTDIKAIKSLTLSNIGLKIPSGGGEFLGKTVALVTGVVTGHFFKTTQYGENIALAGDFVMANATTGEIFEGNTLYMPADFTQNIVQKLEANQGAEIRFPEKGLEIVCTKSEKGARGYAFVVRNAQTVESVNARKQWAEQMLSSMKALPAPKEEKVSTAAPKSGTKSKAA